MKKYSIIAALACILAAASCAKEIAPAEGQTGINPDKVALEVTAAKADFGTKAILEDTGYIAWEAGDAIKVWDGTALNDFTMKEGSPYNDNLSADFQGEASTGAGELLAIAPELAPSVVGGALKLTIPAVQTVDGDHAVDPQALLSVGTIEDGKVSLDNLFALVKVSVGETGVKSIMFQGKGAEAICGTAAYSAGALGAADGTSVTLLHADGTFPVGDYYISIFPQTLASGFDLVLTKADGSKLWKKTTASTAFAQNGGVDFGEVTGTTLGWLPSTITTAAQLVRWGKYAAFYAPDETVTLGADINLDGAAWTPVPLFCGTFDGAGNKIYNFTVASGDAGHCGFIVDLGNGTDVAELKDVIFGSSDGTSYDGSSSITAVQTSLEYGSVDGWSVGPVGRALANAKITGVTNFVPVTASETCAALTRLGGIVGYASSNVIVSGCVNNAAITNNSSLATGAGNMGGILAVAYNGSSKKPDKVINCINNGAVTNNCGGASKIGGIVGFFFKYGEVTGCANNAPVINNVACGTAEEPDKPYIGGIIGAAGYYSKSTSYEISVKGCVNKGEVNQKKASPVAEIYIGGIVGYCPKNITLTITKNGDQRTENYAPIPQQVEYIADAFVGGIAGYVGNAESVIEYSDNKKAASITSYSGQTAVASKGAWGISYGGIAASCKGTVRYCTNSANINTANGTSKKYPVYYLAGICAGCDDMGLPTLVDNCSNTGEIATTYGAETYSKIGGICSAIVYPSNITNCSNYGDVKSNSSNKAHTLGGIVGLIDFSKAAAGYTVLEGCKISCTVYVKAEDARAAFLIGTFQKAAPVNALNIGSAANPVKVKGTYKKGSTPTDLDDTNWSDVIFKRPVVSYPEATWSESDEYLKSNVQYDSTL